MAAKAGEPAVFPCETGHDGCTAPGVTPFVSATSWGSVFLGLRLWQWLGILGWFVGSWIVGLVVGRVAFALATRFAKRTKSIWDDLLVQKLSRPVTFGLGVIVARIGLPSLALPGHVERTLSSTLGVLLLAVLFWTLARAVDVGHEATSHTKWAANHRASRTLLPLGARMAKVALVLLAVVAVVAQLGVPVASLIAGLGIGGLALALAGQKTVENLFGAFAIGLDQPLREGDFVKVDNVTGTVEAIGLRSTRIRTLDRTLIAIPNGKLSEMQIESFSERDRIRLNCQIGLALETKAVELSEVLEGFERVLREHPAIWEDSVIVRLLEIGDSALEVEVMAWFRTQSFDEFRSYRQEVLLAFLHVVEEAGTSISSPSTTVTLVKRADADENIPSSRPAHIGRHRA